jgi:hypothetical protein
MAAVGGLDFAEQIDQREQSSNLLYFSDLLLVNIREA